MKTVEEIIREHPSYKSASLYAALVKAIKTGPLRGQAIPFNRNDDVAKFPLEKAVTRSGRNSHREVTNFIILNEQAFEDWFEENKMHIRTSRALNRTQVVMPRYEDIVAGKYTPEQLEQLAEHVASKRYGAHRSGGRRKGSGTTRATKMSSGRKPGRPRKTM